MRKTDPIHYQDARYEDVPQAIRDLFEPIMETRRGLYIHGPVGSGKTHVAYALKDHFERGGGPTLFWNTTELIRSIRDDYDKPRVDKDRNDERLMESRALLFLDDIGAEKITDANSAWLAETFYLIVNRRYEERRPIIFTSNLPISSIAERIGDRTASRIVEMCHVVELAGSDRRLEKASKITVPGYPQPH